MKRAGIVKWLFLVFCLAWGASEAGIAAETGEKPGLGFGDFEPNLPILFLDANAPILGDEKIDCTVKIVCPKGAERMNCGPLKGQARLHGGSSRRFQKKSYKLGLAEAAQLLDLRQHDNWILNAAYIDRSLMRHKLSYDLFRSLASGQDRRDAVASRFVEMYLNGRYNGVYLLMERVDRDLFGFGGFNSNDVSHACIYKAVDHAANFGSPGHWGYEQHEPDPLRKSYWGPLDAFNRFVSTAPPQIFSDPVTGIVSRLDLGNAIDFHLLVLVTANSDGITKNFYLARNQLEEGKPEARFFFAPWDYDGTFGRNWNASRYPATVWLSNHLFDRLLRVRDYREKFIARWNYLRDHQFSLETIDRLIDANVKTLGQAPRRNATCWPTTYGYPDRLSFDEDITQMKAWTEARLQWLDTQILKNLPNRYR